MSTTADRPSVVKQDLANVIHPIVPHKQLEEHQLVIVSGKDSTVVDADGREYLDGMAGLWCVNIGYGRTELADVAAAQMRKLSYYPHTAMNLPAAALAEKVNGLLGGDNHVYFVSSGSEANEAAFKFARQYARHEFPQQNRSGNDFVHVAPPYCYRCPFGLEPTSCELACVKNMETTILGEGPQTVAEMIIEPVMSAVGVAVPPDDYLPAVANLCKQYGILLHVDEVINGFGRTGRLFAHEHSGVKPDIVTVAKGISSAYLPMAATVVRNSVFKSFIGDASENRQVNQVNTYGGHPAAAAVALRNIEILLEEKLAQRSAENGAYLLDGLRTLTRHPWVGDVRGKGLYAGVELVTDRKSKAIMPAPQIKKLVDRCQERGMIVGRSGGGAHLGNTLVLAPPLVLTRPEIDRMVSVLDQVIPEVCPEAAAA
jgi:taurine-pyruvate aminotransferase